MGNNELKILAIDDIRDNLITIKALISEWIPEAHIYTALSGLEGLEIASKIDPDVILLDIVMPGMDGFDVCRKLKSHPELREIPVVFVTALKADKESRIKGLEVGAEAFLAKPIDQSELVAQIRAMVKIKHANIHKRDENFHLSNLVAERTRELEEKNEATLRILEDLRKSELRLVRAEIASKSGNWELHLKSDKIISSIGANKLFGLENSENNHELIKSVILPEYNDLVQNSLTNLVEKNIPYDVEYKIKHSKTSEIIDIHSFAVYDREHEIVYGVIQDITERKNAKELLKQTHLNYETYFNTIDEFLFVIDLNANIIHTNQTVVDRLTYSNEELSKMKIFDLQPKENRAEQKRIFNNILLKKSDTCAIPLKTKEGKFISVESKISHGQWNGEPVIFKVSKDISKIILSEEKFSKLFQLNPLASSLCDAETGKYIEVNNAYENLLGFESEEVIGSSGYELGLYDDETNKLFKAHDGIDGNLMNIETKLYTKSKNIKHAVITSQIIGVQDKKYRFTVINDITERIDSEAKIIKSEIEFRKVWESSANGLRLTDADGNILRVNDSYCNIFELSNEEIIGKTIATIYQPKDLPKTINKYKDKFKSRSVDFHVEKEFKLLNGKKKWFQIENSFLDIEGEQTLLLGIFTDISLRKYAEEKVQYLSRLYAFLSQINQAFVRTNDLDSLYNKICEIAVDYGGFKMAWIGIPDFENNLIIQHSNYGYENGYLTKIKTINNNDLGIDILSKNMENDTLFICDDISNDSFDEKMRHEALDSGYHSAIIIPILQNNKLLATLNLYASQIGSFDKDEQKLLLEIADDISFAINAYDAEKERKRTEEALLESENRYITFINNNIDMIFVKDEHFRYLIVNDSLANFFGKTKNEMLHKTDQELSDENLTGPCKSSDERALASETPISFIENLGDRTFETTKFRMPLQKGKYGIGGILHDITSRREAEKALQKSEMFLRTFIDNAPFEIWARDINNVGILENKMLVENFGSIIGKKPSDSKLIDFKLAKSWETLNKKVVKGTMIDHETEFWINKVKIDFHQIIFPIVIEEETVGVAGFNIDISERKKEQIALRDSQEQLKKFAAHLQNIREEERILLAREIHDELGQILVALKIDLGMLGKRAQKAVKEDTSEDFIAHFQQITNLVDTTIKTSRRIMNNLRPEALDVLGLIESFRIFINSFQERYKINCIFITEMDKLELELQSAVALFRILQESLNNIAKHAMATKVKVKLGYANSDLLFFEIIDNGIGFNVDEKRNAESYGMIGMKERVFLVDGKFSITSKIGKGTKIRIEIPIRLATEN